MKEITGDIWNYHLQGHLICITTNGMTRRDGSCVMGRGIARQAAIKFPTLPYEIGDNIRYGGNHVYWFSKYQLFTFPVKHKWYEKADIDLIQRSCLELSAVCGFGEGCGGQIYLVRPGCGNGGLSWSEVRPHVAALLDDRFTIVERV